MELIDGDRPKISRYSKAVIVQRTAVIDKQTAERLVASVKQKGIKLFVDTDDAFGDLDKNHPQYDLQRDRVEALNLIMQEADEVWFSTEKLQQGYGLKNSVVVRNTLDTNIWQKLRDEKIVPVKPGKPLQILYMGTKTHDGDFGLILPVLHKLYKKYPGQFELHMIGVASKTDDEPWLVNHPPKNGLYPLFVDWFNGEGPFDIGISPLEDSTFNANKSDIKCLDYLAIGVKPVVSDVIAYKNPELNDHIIRVKNNETAWFKTLENELLQRDPNRKKVRIDIQEAVKYLKAHRTSEKAGETILGRFKKNGFIVK